MPTPTNGSRAAPTELASIPAGGDNREQAKLAAEREEQARRETLAENGIIIDDHDFDHALN